MPKLNPLFLFTILLLSGCSGNKTSFSGNTEFEAYVNDPENGFINSSETGDYLIETRMEPATDEDPEKSFQVHLRISRTDGKSVLESAAANTGEVMEIENYLSFDILEDTYMKNGEDAVSATFHHYEHNYGLKPSIDIFFEFPHFNPQETPTFVYRDKIFGMGMIRIPFDKKLFTICHVNK